MRWSNKSQNYLDIDTIPRYSKHSFVTVAVFWRRGICSKRFMCKNRCDYFCRVIVLDSLSGFWDRVRLNSSLTRWLARNNSKSYEAYSRGWLYNRGIWVLVKRRRKGIREDYGDYPRLEVTFALLNIKIEKMKLLYDMNRSFVSLCLVVLINVPIEMNSFPLTGSIVIESRLCFHLTE